MSVLQMKVKNNSLLGSAPLQNLNIIEGVLLKAANRPEHLPGIVTFTGPSGFGKSTAASYVTSKYNAAYLEFRSVWTKKAFLTALAKELGLPENRTMHHLAETISEELAYSQKPVILDEFDHAVEKEGFVELVRDIYEQSKSPILLIGEEQLPHKLQKWERFHGRILSWSLAQPANVQDARALNNHYYPNTKVEDDLLTYIVEQSKGSVRRIVTNLEEITSFALSEGAASIDRKLWGVRALHKSVAPSVRSF